MAERKRTIGDIKRWIGMKGKRKLNDKKEGKYQN